MKSKLQLTRSLCIFVLACRLHRKNMSFMIMMRSDEHEHATWRERKRELRRFKRTDHWHLNVKTIAPFQECFFLKKINFGTAENFTLIECGVMKVGLLREYL